MIGKNKIKYIRSLELRKNREHEGVFVAEGPKVVADLMAVARDENPHNTGYACDDLPRASIVPPAEWRSRYYVRVMVEDEPGVLRDLAGCMADQGVSMAQVIQRTDEGKGVPLVFMTHETTEEAMSTALQRTLDTGMLRQPAVYFRVLD